MIKEGQNPGNYAKTVLEPPPGVSKFMPEIRQRRVERRYLELKVSGKIRSRSQIWEEIVLRRVTVS